MGECCFEEERMEPGVNASTTDPVKVWEWVGICEDPYLWEENTVGRWELGLA
jgi:hypothetical protein